MDNLTPLLKRYIHPMEPIPTGVRPVLDTLKPYSAILFDIYGTLLISGAGEIGIHRRLGQCPPAIADLMKRHGIDGSPDWLRRQVEAQIRTVHQKARDQGIDCPEVDIIRIWREVIGTDDIASIKAFALAYELIVNPIYPMPGAAELLSAAGRAGIINGIVSNAQFYTPLILNWVFQGATGGIGFDEGCCFFSYREGHAKPSAFMFEKAGRRLAKMGIPKEAVLYVGNDMLNDILPARAVGYMTALFAGDNRSLRMRADDARLEGVTPDLIVTDLRQLLPGIENPKT